MLRDQWRSGIAHVGLALREPEDFAAAWHEGSASYAPWVWIALGLTAILGTTTYGMTMGILGGAGEIARCGLLLTVAAGVAWGTALPALYILNSLAGSKLRASTTLLAALVTTSWGGLALIASIPINWLFSVALPSWPIPISVPFWVTLVNLVVFAGVGVSMLDVFGRVMRRLEPRRGRAPTWYLALVAVIGSELFYAFGLFDFAGRM